MVDRLCGCCGTGPKHCFLWARILLAFGCCGAGPKHCFLWVPKVTCMRHSFGVFFAFFCLAWARLMLAFGCFGTEALFFMGSKGDVKHSVCVFFAWHGLESCWCFGLFESDADETLSGHRSESTFHTVFCLAEARLLLAFGCFGTEALSFLMGSKGDVKHSVCVFFAWHGLESCWCFGLFESDADETLSSHRSESTFRTVFCLAETRLLLAFGCFGTEALFFMWSILFACFLLGMGSNLAGVLVFSTLTLTRLWAAIVRNPRRSGVPEPDQSFFYLVFFIFLADFFFNLVFFFIFLADYRFQRWREAFCHRVFCLAWARILLAFGCCGTGRKHCFLWARILLVFRSFRIWRWRDFEQPSFGIHVLACGYMCVSNSFLLGRGSTAAGVRVFRNRSFVSYGFQRWREAFCLRVFCLAWARILLVFWSFRIWRWRDFEQPSFGIHGVRVFRNRTKALFFIVFFYIFSGF